MHGGREVGDGVECDLDHLADGLTNDFSSPHGWWSSDAAERFQVWSIEHDRLAGVRACGAVARRPPDSATEL